MEIQPTVVPRRRGRTAAFALLGLIGVLVVVLALPLALGIDLPR